MSELLTLEEFRSFFPDLEILSQSRINQIIRFAQEKVIEQKADNKCRDYPDYSQLQYSSTYEDGGRNSNSDTVTAYYSILFKSELDPNRTIDLGWEGEGSFDSYDVEWELFKDSKVGKNLILVETQGDLDDLLNAFNKMTDNSVPEKYSNQVLFVRIDRESETDDGHSYTNNDEDYKVDDFILPHANTRC